MIAVENDKSVDVLLTVDTILVFLSEVLNDFTSSTNQPFFSQIGSHLYEKIASLLIQHYLDPVVPKTYKELSLYSSQIGEKFISLERKWLQRFVPVDGNYLESYCNDIVSISLKSWRANLLNETRDMIIGSDYEYEILEPYDASKTLSTLFVVLY